MMSTAQQQSRRPMRSSLSRDRDDSARAQPEAWTLRHAPRRPIRRTPSAERLSVALGWLSVGIGVAELAAPRRLARTIGVDGHPALIRALGARELANGLAILMQPHRAGLLRARVAGDAIDLALLGVALGLGDERRRGSVAIAAAAVAGVTLLDVLCSRQLEREGTSAPGALRRDGTVRVEKSVAVNRPPTECYALWRDFTNLPRFMKHLRVGRSHRRQSLALGRQGAGRTHGRVGRGDHARRARRAASPGVRCTVRRSRTRAPCASCRAGGTRHGRERVEMQYKPPAGALGAARAPGCSAKSPTSRCSDDLRRFKQLMETGEIPTTEGQPAGKRGILVSHAAQGAASMKATCWHGRHDVRVENVPDPKILNPRDAIVKITSHRDLRLRPAPLRRLHPHHGEGRHPRPRVHGRGGRGRPRR